MKFPAIPQPLLIIGGLGAFATLAYFFVQKRNAQLDADAQEMETANSFQQNAGGAYFGIPGPFSGGSTGVVSSGGATEPEPPKMQLEVKQGTVKNSDGDERWIGPVVPVGPIKISPHTEPGAS